MSVYGIDIFNFEFWEGPPPPVPTPKVIESHRPGATGVAQQIIGTWGDTFDAKLTAHFANQLAAITAHAMMKAVIGTGPMPVKYNNINWSGMYGVVYHVDDIQLVSLRSVPRILGPTYDFPGGAILITKWTLTPQQV